MPGYVSSIISTLFNHRYSQILEMLSILLQTVIFYGIFVTTCMCRALPIDTPIACTSTFPTTDGKTCGYCPSGYYKVGDCRTDGNMAECRRCGENTFQPNCNNDTSCKLCQRQCPYPYMELVRPCSEFHDLKCECSDGYTWVADDYSLGEGLCLPDRNCTAGQGYQDAKKKCIPCVKGQTFSTSTSTGPCGACTVCNSYNRKCTVEQDAECMANTSMQSTPTKRQGLSDAEIVLAVTVPALLISILALGIVACRKRQRKTSNRGDASIAANGVTNGTDVDENQALNTEPTGTMLDEVGNGTMANGVANKTMVNEAANGTMLDEVANGTMANGVANVTMVNGMANGTMLDEVANGTMLDEVANGAMVNGVANGTVADENQAQNTEANGKMPNEVAYRAMANGVANVTMVNEVANGTMLDEVANGTMANGVANVTMVNGIANGTMANGVANGTVVDENQAQNTEANGTMPNEVAHRAMANGVANVTMVNGVANGTMANGVANITMVNGVANVTMVNGVANGTMVNGVANVTMVNGVAYGTVADENQAQNTEANGTMPDKVARGAMANGVANGTRTNGVTNVKLPDEVTNGTMADENQAQNTEANGTTPDGVANGTMANGRIPRIEASNDDNSVTIATEGQNKEGDNDSDRNDIAGVGNDTRADAKTIPGVTRRHHVTTERDWRSINTFLAKKLDLNKHKSLIRHLVPGEYTDVEVWFSDVAVDGYSSYEQRFQLFCKLRETFPTGSVDDIKHALGVSELNGVLNDFEGFLNTLLRTSVDIDKPLDVGPIISQETNAMKPPKEPVGSPNNGGHTMEELKEPVSSPNTGEQVMGEIEESIGSPNTSEHTIEKYKELKDFGPIISQETNPCKHTMEDLKESVVSPNTGEQVMGEIEESIGSPNTSEHTIEKYKELKDFGPIISQETNPCKHTMEDLKESVVSPNNGELTMEELKEPVGSTNTSEQVMGEIEEPVSSPNTGEHAMNKLEESIGSPNTSEHAVEQCKEPKLKDFGPIISQETNPGKHAMEN